jgi:2-isopropylmalate synthase
MRTADGGKEMMTMSRKIYIFDTTLRDGEQAPGCSMNHQEKLRVATHLESMGVDVIEAGFAVASPGDFAAVKAIAGVVKNATVASLARALAKDIDAAWDALRDAVRPRIHIFLATSPIHMAHKLNMTPDQVYQRAVDMVKHARRFCGDVQFSLEDASRSELDFVYRMVEGVIRAGATVVNIPDTVGYAVPAEFAALVRNIREHVPNVDKAVLAVHCHNDLGLAVANSLAAVQAGAQQVECTVNGLGERAGNAAMEEVVMALKTRRDVYDVGCGVDTTRIHGASRLVCAVTGVKVQPNKAIVGENAFAHESGIHQHGMMVNASTYEIMTPESIGLARTQMVLGKHSGRHAFEGRLKEWGFAFDEQKIAGLFAMFKELADRKKTVTDADIEALARGVETQVAEQVKLDRFVVQSGNAITASATVSIVRDGRTLEQVSTGDGPIDAAFKAVDQLVGVHPQLESFTLSAVTGGEDAQGEAVVKIRQDDRLYNGRGVSTDVVEASIRAYLAAINVLLNEKV